MKLRNSTDWPDHFIRRMVAWCAKKVELSARDIRYAEFTKCRHCGRGRAWSSMRFLVRVGAEGFPRTFTHAGTETTWADSVEALVNLTAHELTHLLTYRDGSYRSLKNSRDVEGYSDRIARYVLNYFRDRREALLTEWSAPPKQREAAPKPSVVQRRATKAADDLARWQRKLKLAQTKVRKLKQKVRYYERTAATRPT